MGSNGEKKSGLVGEKSHTVYSANWKLDAMLEKELGMLDTSKRRVEHRISMDQVVAKKRFQVKLHRSKLFHARMKGDKEMLKKLINRDNYNFNTNTSSVDVLNKRREKDLEKKRILHRASQEKMMMMRNVVPQPATPTSIPELPGADPQQAHNSRKSEELPSVTIRPMTAVERITNAKLLASGKVNAKIRPKTAAVDGTGSSRMSLPSTNKTPAHHGIAGLPGKMKPIAESTGTKETRDTSLVMETNNNLDNEPSREIVIEITQPDELDCPRELDHEPTYQQNHDNVEQTSPVLSSNSPKATQSSDDTSSKERLNTDCKDSDKRDENVMLETVAIVPKKSNLRPTTALGIRSTSKSADALSSSNTKRLRPRTSVSISEQVSSDQSDNESTTNTSRRPSFSQSSSGRRKSTTSKSRRRKSAMNIFTDQKKLTIMDVDEERRQRAKHNERIVEYVNTIDNIKTDPDQIVDYYMARLLEESSISSMQKNVKRIRDMPDSEYDLDLSKRSIGNLKDSTITFRDVNRNYDEYKHDPYTPLHPTSMGYGLISRTSTMGTLNTQDSRVTMPTTAWQGDESDTD